jgi:hypothetical protein
MEKLQAPMPKGSPNPGFATGMMRCPEGIVKTTRVRGLFSNGVAQRCPGRLASLRRAYFGRKAIVQSEDLMKRKRRSQSKRLK